MKQLFFTFLILATGLNSTVLSQTHAYADDIATIKKFDNIYSPPANPILFIGSSSIRKWTSLDEAFGNYKVINRGIGGAITSDITYYANDLIFPYQPRQIVVYVGENDLPEATATPDSLLSRFKVLYKTIRTQLPNVPIAYISIKPSPVRAQYQDKARKSNALIRQFLAKEVNAVFINVYDLMLDKNGKMRPEIFIEDKLHMNRQGYSIWEKALKPYLIK
ncbi:GDSL family lipase [Pedobacter sp. HMF7647]|uniref:GDSL family lipase n=1 Tax=Hufsiella arboris TaxID=2695275 RepID=A0A7K1YB47_9SPHI|nr:GDSL-type esterase/lipase family protein [Hufsiella arboris]MXV51812.1 GDSL family lipase [Hufsiella arboris]